MFAGWGHTELEEVLTLGRWRGWNASANTASANQSERSLLNFTPIDLLTGSLGCVQIPAEVRRAGVRG